MKETLTMKNSKAYCLECKYCIKRGAYAPEECVKSSVNIDTPLVKKVTYTTCEVKNKNNDCTEFEQTNCLIRIINEFRYTSIGY